MTDRPMILRDHEVRACLDGRKTQHRLILKPQPEFCGPVRFATMLPEQCVIAYSTPAKVGLLRIPYAIGDRFWVRERFIHYQSKILGIVDEDGIAYRADWSSGVAVPWCSPVAMPRRFSRLTWVVTDLRVQRVRDITSAEAISEGMASYANGMTIDCDTPDPRDDFSDLWNDRHGPDAWERNDWVAALTVRVIRENIDSVAGGDR